MMDGHDMEDRRTMQVFTAMTRSVGQNAWPLPPEMRLNGNAVNAALIAGAIS